MTVFVKNSAIKPQQPVKSEFNSSSLITCTIVVLLFVASVIVLKNLASRDDNEWSARISLDLSTLPSITLAKDTEMARARNVNCTFWKCLDVYKCGQQKNGRIGVYVYPLKSYTSPDGVEAFKLTKEFYTIIRAIVKSPYYTANPNRACIFVPSIDTLNQRLIEPSLVGKALAALPYWNGGDNHLLFNMVPGDAPNFNTVLDVNTDRAIIAGAGFDTWTYRYGFDFSIPLWSPFLGGAGGGSGNGGSTGAGYHPKGEPLTSAQRPFTLVSAQQNLLARHTKSMQDIAYDNPDVLFLQNCGDRSPDADPIVVKNKRTGHIRCSFPTGEAHVYPTALEKGIFCLVARGLRLAQTSLLEALAAGCIPVVMADNAILPFAEVIDWTLAALVVREADIHSLMVSLKSVSADRIEELTRQGRWLFQRYFNGVDRIAMAVLDELNDRVYPHFGRTYLDWNMPPNAKAAQNPLFLPVIAPKSQGFTAVILTFDRVDSLFTLIQKLSIVSSLQKILVIWNNQKKAPPHLTMFPKINKPLKIIQTKENKLSNRFYPYEDIETEAILTIDDDIVMLTSDELDFGYEVWREFPDRIVGFPSRTHVWDNVTNRWRYESEWTNQISMVLTGAAFHHKYWSYMYTNAMPGDIKEWVDEHMNCEDIAMNFLVANITNKPPIKVAPRKKFKCPECTNTEMLSADLNHMMERSACIDRFSKIYGTMPLKTVEFRADPVLFKDNFPEKLKRFNDIGSL